MFEDDGEGGLTAMHHPFTSPRDMSPEELKNAPEDAIANAYDMVYQQLYEVGGGSDPRIHRNENAADGIRHPQDHTEEQRRKFGFAARCVTMRRTTACRSGLWSRPSGDAADRYRKHPVTLSRSRNHGCRPDLMTDAPSFANDDALKELAIASNSEEVTESVMAF